MRRHGDFSATGDELTVLHRLNILDTLHRSLVSTNAIENSIRTTRRKLGRVKRSRADSDQASNWLAFSLLEVGKGFRHIAGHHELAELLKALEQPDQSTTTPPVSQPG